MFLVTEALFIILLVVILVMLRRSERNVAKNTMPRARIEEWWDGKERRSHIRFRKALEVDYSIENNPRLNNRCKTVDISEGGMKLLLEEKPAKGSILSLKVILPDIRKVAEVKGEVVWLEDVAQSDQSGKRFFCSGIKFAEIKQPPGNPLLEYIRSLPAAFAE